jgi:2-aminoethylphosphonate-pyruvate transaminase
MVMNMSFKKKLLFTPGPLSTSQTVKEAMLVDVGSRDEAFKDVIADVRARLLQVAGVSADEFAVVLMQGSGSFGVESVVGSVIEPSGALLVLINGAYGQRLAKIAQMLKINTRCLATEENEPPDLNAMGELLGDKRITHVAMVHCETTTGILNPIEELLKAAKDAGKTTIVDAMSTFGATKIDMAHVDYLISSANKCIEGVPGFAFVLARKKHLLGTEGWARSHCMDLLMQYHDFERERQFRFTPATHTVLAFHQALIELEQEGGWSARQRRYQQNQAALQHGMQQLGFTSYVPKAYQSHIIASYHYPTDPNFDFERFYCKLSERGFVIYPGKVTDAPTFRIGNIGQVFLPDISALIGAIKDVLAEMKVQYMHLPRHEDAARPAA